MDERTVLKCILMKKGCESVEWIHLAQDRDQWMSRDHGNVPSSSIKGLGIS